MNLLQKKIERLELRIAIYSERDYEVVKELEAQLHQLQLQLLTQMSDDNDVWLRSHYGKCA